jgi:predicted Zn finger-like uncharacterized protein
MHTRCPQCHTVFVVQPAQLAARDGLVRCGRCMTVFNAQESRVDKAAENTPAAATMTQRKPAKKTGGKEKPAAARKAGAKEAPDTPRRRKDTAPRQKTPPEPVSTGPLQLSLPGLAPRLRTRLPFWILGNVLLLSTILAQGIYFYGSELAHLSPALKPALAGVCHVLGCTLTPPQDINLIDLVEARVAPHPKFNKALRIRATLVNRASFSQAFPTMEVTLSDNTGQVVARRAFKPGEYVEKTRVDGELMPPNVAIPVLLDVTHPDNRALGYEIRLLPTN